MYQKNSEILYKILIKFHNYFIKPLNQDIQFYYDFIGYVMANKDIKTFEKVLKYIKDIVTFLDVIYKYRDDIISYFTKPIKIKPELKLIKKNILMKMQKKIGHQNMILIQRTRKNI